jgi:hypothetical protein
VCGTLNVLVTDYLEERLSEPERGRFEAHLAVFRDWRRAAS